jgi:hypothetical protein
MRKLFIIAAMFIAPLFVSSCGSGSQQTEEVVVDSTAVDSVGVVEEALVVDSAAVVQ